MTTYNNERIEVAVITGSSRGIGKSIAMEFAKSGYSLMLNSRDEKELNSSIEDILKNTQINKEKISYLVGDVSQESICESLIQETVRKFGRIDVLVNNAGIRGASKPLYEISADEWDEVININLRSAFLCTREAVKQMLKGLNDNTNNIYKDASNSNNNNYSIINISSYHESVPQIEGIAYTSSKGGMEMLTKTAALELTDKGIRVNGVAPGAIETDMQKDVIADEQKKKQKENKSPIRRFGKPEEIAKVVLFLASDDASYIAGTTVYVDGGRALT